MKKQRMKISELRDLKPSLDNPIELVCDDDEYAEDMSTIKVLGFYDKCCEFIAATKNGEVLSFPTEILSHYPSQKPEPRFEEVALYTHTYSFYLLDRESEFVYTDSRHKSRNNRKFAQFLKERNPIAKLKMNSDTFEIVGMWEDGE